MSRQIATRRIAATQKAMVVNQNNYSDRLLKLIPAEVVSVYIAVFNLIKDLIHQKAQVDSNVGNDNIAIPWFWGIFILLGAGNVFYMKQTGVTDWRQVLITTVAYILWVLSIGGPVVINNPEIISPQIIASIFVPVFTLFIPVFYK